MSDVARGCVVEHGPSLNLGSFEPMNQRADAENGRWAKAVGLANAEVVSRFVHPQRFPVLLFAWHQKRTCKQSLTYLFF